ncbi:MAG: amino acid adenylation domain-containing protein [Cytophagales bacterium]|nr:amino acid adenylation domain-containing protein [Cytophagales bacterium]
MKKDYNGMEIAVIGMSGRFPGANDIGEFWQNLKSSKESITFSSREDLLNSGEKEHYINHPNYVKASSYLQNKENFDASFFGYVPDEASLMDPQMRVFHECVWGAMEDAGYIMSENKDKVGVFAGGATNVNWQNYAQIINSGREVDELSAYVFRDVNYIATRISYLFNLRGPSIYINSACSTSLVAIQRASMSLLLRECDMALAGGVSIGNKAEKGYMYQEGMTASKDGHCRAFDADASGTIRGEGAGVVVLKRLKDAIADKDNIHAVIRGSAVNNDGRNKVGYTAPGISGQQQTHLKARKMANVPAESISYIEAHGTGTPLGDPIEIEALTLAYGKSEKKYCALGSVKTNIGHLDAAAGVAGFIKTVLSLKHRQLPASLHFERPNPKINFDASPFYVNTELKDWKVEGYPLRAGVSSFGIGGTNAHVILEEAPEVSSTESKRSYQLLKLSGKTSGALQRNATHLLEYLENAEEASLSDIAYTLNTGRESFSHRKVLVCRDREEAIVQLREMQDSRGTKALSKKTNYKVVFMFPGQGSQHVNMCRDLYDREPSFRESIDQCFELITKLSGRDLKQVVFSEGSTGIDDLENALPLLFSFEYSLAKLLMSWGIQPDSMIGHSNAEYIAACLSGLLSLESALGLIVRRGELMQQMPAGKMLSVSISSQDLQPYLDQAPEIAFAAHNSATSCVVSGPPEAVDAFQALLEGAGIMTKSVRSSHAGHSQMMDGMLDAYREELERVTFSELQTPFMSNYTGKEASYEEVSKPDYWLKHLRHTVKFSEGIGELMSSEHVLFVEVGPGKTLGSFVGAHPKKGRGHQVVNMLGHPKEEENDFKRVFEGLGKLWVHGHQPDWSAFYGNEERKKVSLPTYSFEKEQYPANVDATKMIMEMMSVQRPVSTSLSECLYVPSWESSELIKEGHGLGEKGEHLTLFFCDDSWQGLADGLLSSLNAKGDTVIEVRKGTSFEEKETAFTIDPEDRNHYDRLLGSIDRKGKDVRIIFGWGLSVEEPQIRLESYRKKLGESYFSLLDLTRSVSEWVGKDRVEITTLTHRLHQVLGKEAVLADQSPMLGAVKVIPKEYTNISCRNIDLNRVDGDEELIGSLLDELHYSDGEQLVSYRYGTRFTPSLRQKIVDLPANNEELSWVAGGVYLITGGLGGVGLTYADQLSKEVPGVKLILLGRRTLPPKSDWASWLTLNKKNKEEDPQYSTIATLLKIEERGGEVYYVSIDLTDAAALKSELTRITQQTGQIRGVIHTAGIGDFAGVIHKRSREDCEEIFSSKIYGTIALTSALEGKELDFTVYCSSFSSVSAPFGQVSYVAANLFLESFARSQSLVQQGKVISIGWNQWSEVGIAAREIAAKRFNLSEDSITPEEGYDLLKRSLKLNRPEVFITRYDPMANRDQPQAVVSLSPSSVDTAADKEEASTKELSISSYSDLETGLLELWQSFFGKTDLEVEDDFFEIGGDSLKALTMTRRINMHFQVDISLVDFFKHSTIVSLASYLSDQEGQSHESIAKAEEQPHYGLSSAQRRLYFLYEFDRSSLAYNLPQVVRFEGDLDREQLAYALQQLVDRHEALRTSFEMVGEEVVQRVHADCALDIACYEAEESEVSSLVKAFIRPFDLSTAPLIRVGLIRVSEADHVLMVDTHHIVSDGTSQGILIGDFMRLYQGEELTALSLQYKDYSQWQGSEAYQSGLLAQRDYWQGIFSEPVTVMELPTDHARPRLMEHRGGKIGFMLEAKETAALKQLTREEGTTMFMVLLSALNVLLSKLSNQEDIVIGTPTAGRNHTDLEEMIGMFVNTLVLRNNVAGAKTFRQFLQEVKERTLRAFDNQGYQYEDLIDLLQVSREPNRNPLFDVMFVFQNFEYETFSVPGIKSKSYDSTPNLTSKFDLTFRAAESKDHLHFNVVYATELFSEATITRFVSYFKKIVSAIAEDTTTKLARIDMLPEREKVTLLREFNQTSQVYDEQQTVVSLFEQQVAQAPDNIALMCEGVPVSYGLLHELSERLAVKISSLANDSGIVALFFNPSLEMIVSILASMKSGSAFLPLDPEHSLNRNEDILKSSGSKILLTRKDLEKEIQFSDKKIAVDLEELKEKPPIESSIRPVGNDPVYLIYTSGSSGKPKGVEVSHSNLVNYSLWFGEFIQLSNKDKSILTSSYAFDLGYSSIFPTLIAGGELHLVSKELYSSPEQLLSYLSAHAITYLKLTPSLFSTFSLVDDDQFQVSSALSYIVFGGESIKTEHLEAELSRFGEGVNFVNHYGPTETTIGTVATHIHRESISAFEKRPLIGKPVANAQCYVLGKNHELLPVGVAGELCISGHGVALGYHQEKSLTDQKFIPNPHNKEQLIYKTGDMARWLPDGNLEFLGRIDHQVKIRGFRVELSEIENQLASHADITDVHVVAKERDNHQYLVGYYIAKYDIEANELRNYLAELLPDYMLPSYFVQLEEFPLTLNGKVDHRALPKEDITRTTNHVPPKTEKEKALCEVWSQVLRVDQIGIRDNFFAIGGDSIKSIQISSRMRQVGYEMSIKDIFNSQTIEQLAPKLKLREITADQSEVTGEVPFTAIQRWYFAQQLKSPHHYNQSVMLNFSEGITDDTVYRIFDAIQSHHDALRMRFRNEGDRTIQENQPKGIDVAITEVDLKQLPDPQKELLTLCNEVQSSIDLESGPLMKLGLFHLNDGSRLLIAVHHLVMDGVSWRIVFEDIETLYTQIKKGDTLTLPPKTDAFKKWAHGIQSYLQQDQFLSKQSYWQTAIDQDFQAIPRDFPEGGNRYTDASTISFQLDENLTQLLLTKVNRPYATQINDILLSALLLSIKACFNTNNLRVDFEGHGREEILKNVDISRTIGWFTSIYPVQLNLEGDDLSDLIKSVKEKLRAVPNNGVDYLISKFLTEDAFNEDPVVADSSIRFNYLGQFDSDTEDRVFAMASEQKGLNHTLEEERVYDWDFSGMVSSGHLSLSLTYSQLQYHRETVVAVMETFKEKLEDLIQYCSQLKIEELTPSDLTYKNLTIPQLELLQSQYKVSDVYPLSSMQEGMLFHALLDREADFYFEQISYRLKGQVDIGAIEKSFSYLIERYDILRTLFLHEGFERPLQVVLKERKPDLSYHDLTEELENGDFHETIQAYRDQDKANKFNLSRDPLMRVIILKVNEDEYEFIWSHHHILMDGWCMGVIINEFSALYRSFKHDTPIDLPPVQPYSSYIGWLEDRDKKAAVNYWAKYLQGYEKIATLPKNLNSPQSAGNYQKRHVSAVLNKVQTDALRKLGGQYGVTLNTIIQSLWAVLLARYNNTKDVVFGTVVSGRPAEISGIETMVGLFINTIPTRITFDAADTLGALLQKVQQISLETEEFHYNSLPEIQSHSELGKDLIDHIMVFENYPISKEIEGNAKEEGDYLVHHMEVFEQSHYDLTILVFPGDEIRIEWQYNGLVFADETIENVRGHLLNIFDAAISNSETLPAEIDLLSPEDRSLLLKEFNATEEAYDQYQTLIHLFDRWVKETPDEEALIFDDQTLSYRELNNKVDKQCARLQKEGIGTGDIIAVMIERSPEMVIGILAVLKSGAAYLPIDTELPDSRIRFMLKESGAALLFTESLHLDSFRNTIRVLDILSIQDGAIGSFQPVAVSPTDLAYIIYTSGSTGRPKGVMVEHRSVINLVKSLPKHYGITDQEKFLLFANVSFDASVEQMWLAFDTGGTLVVPDREMILSETLLNAYLRRTEVSHLHVTPSFLANSNLENMPSLKRINVGGEMCPVNVVQKYAADYPIFNSYGPTEATVTTHVYAFDPETLDLSTLPLGKAVANTQTFILSEEDNLQPMGVVGEICISGYGLSCGYLNDDSLTAAKFVENPFDHNSRLYRTGDLGRWLPDGNIEILGRVDDQVKVRGFRIETGEIESCLTSHDSVNASAILVIGEGNEKEIVAYYLSEGDVSHSELRDYLAMQLPHYMLPSRFVGLEEFPINTNGKLDRKALANISSNEVAGVVKPITPTQEYLLTLWSEVLKKKKEHISINKSFFELGGHSLKAMMLVNKISQDLDIALPVREVFAHEDIISLAAHIDTLDSDLHTAITRAPEKPLYAASSAQQRLFFLHELERDSVAYNMPRILRLKGELKRDQLEKAFETLIYRHDIFRTSIELFNGEVVQRVADHPNFEITHFEADEQRVEGIVRQFIRPFDLGVAPLFRVGLIHLSADEHVLMMDIHHIISDGASQGHLINELMRVYNGEQLQDLPLQYRDYAEWQQRETQQDRLSRQRSFWLREFEEDVTALDLPTDHARPKEKDYSGATTGFLLATEASVGLKTLSEKQGTTMFMTFLSIFNVLLSKLGNVQDIVVGTPVAGRNHADLEGMQGMFVNTLALRNYPDDQLSFEAFLQNVKERVFNCFENQDYQYEELVDALDLNRDQGRNPLFDVAFVYQNFEEGTQAIPDLTVHPMNSGHDVAKFDLTFTVSEIVENFHVHVNYATELFDPSTIDRFNGYLKALIGQVATDATVKLSEIDVLSDEERNQQISVFNATKLPYNRDETLVDIFEQWVERTPDETALIFHGETLSYLELNQRSNDLCAQLQGSGVRKGDIVAIMIERSPELVIGILAILKAGAAYLPIDTKLPVSRVRFMLEDSGARILLTETDKIESGEYDLAAVDVRSHESVEGTYQPVTFSSGDLAYVIYTSGSTGTPKGVMIEHRSLINLLHDHKEKMSITQGERMLMFSSVSFDASVGQIWYAFNSGSAVVVVDEKTLTNTELLNAYLVKSQVSYFEVMPSFLSSFELEDNPYLKRIVVGGEKCPVHLAEKYSRSLDFFNAYGPTEATIVTNIFHYNKRVYDRSSVPIGKQIANSSAYILSRSNTLQPIGVVGELYLGGDCLGRGYLNNQTLTNERFIQSPFRSDERLYKTGDLARWLPDGNVEFIGRIDDQVKIRGFRIETGEIESCLLKLESITAAAVIVLGNGNDAKLVTYYVAPEKLPVGRMKDQLSEFLPAYMVPAHFVHLNFLPVTRNAKLDRKALPKVEIQAVEEDFVGPETATEEKMVELWSDVLKLKKDVISVDHNFFDLGGHSLKAMTLTNKITESLAVKVPVKELFTYQDIRSLANFIDGLSKKQRASIPRAPEKTYYASSAAQQRQYFLNEFDKHSTAYNIPQVVRIEGEFDAEKLEEAFRTLIDRHEIFRTAIELVEGSVVQRVIEDPGFEMQHYEPGDRSTEEVVKQFIQPFDLSQPPLLRVGLVTRSTKDRMLMIDMHHVISDGVSQGYLINELISIYNGKQLHDLTLHYKDYAEWQQSEAEQTRLSESKVFWLNAFEQEIKILNLPGDFSRPKVKDYSGAISGCLLSAEESVGLKALNKEQGTTMFMTMLSVLNVLLSKLSNEQDIIVGTPTSGRTHADLERMQGMFVNTLPLRNYPKHALRFDAFLRQVKENVLNCFEHQVYQYEDLVEALELTRDTGRNPMFDVMFAYHRYEEEAEAIQDLRITSVKNEHVVAKFDLSFTVNELKDGLHLSVNYATELFRSSTINRFLNYFKKVISCVIADVAIPLSEIDILSPEERHELLNECGYSAESIEKDTTLVDLFERSVEQHSDEIALIAEKEELSYFELNRRVNEQCLRLQKANIKPGDIVAVMIERSPEMVIAILAVLKSGAAYLPIDTSLPGSRVLFMLQESAAKLLLTERTYVSQFEKALTVLDTRSETNLDGQPYQPVGFSPSELAYIIYTSGSTGQPKGVMVEHRSVINLVQSLPEQYGIADRERILLFANVSFDASVEQMWLAFGTGGTLVVPNKEMILSEHLLNTFLQESGVTHLHVTPSFLASFELSKSNALRRINVGGEKCPVHVVQKYAANYPIYNSYGPTEATVTTHVYSFVPGSGDWNALPLGKAVANTRTYVLNEQGKLQPRGVVGEICISGEGLSRGYVNNPTQTSLKFIESPFEKGERLYKTGDLGRRLPDGTIEILGRVDDQVKIRGYRVELGEIESHILAHESVIACAVLLMERGDVETLVAYYVSKEQDLESSLSHVLSRQLPAYMVPAQFILLDLLPVTANGKLDRKAIGEQEIQTKQDYVPPNNPVQQRMVSFWAEVLNLREDEISIDQSFFQLGGNSLKAMILFKKLSDSFEVPMALVDLFSYPTINEFSTHFALETEEPLRSESDELVRLKHEQSNEKNLFFIHDGSGDLLGYLDLVSHLAGCNCWGIRSGSLSDLSYEVSNVHEIASKYIDLIKSIQPQGPYHLAGWSFGGVIAHEMAYQLEAESAEKVAQVFMFDTVLNENTQQVQGDLLTEIQSAITGFFDWDTDQLLKAKSFEELLMDFKKLTSLNNLDAVSVLRTLPEGIRNMLPTEDNIDIENMLMYFKTIAMFRRVMLSYRPKGKVDAPLLYVHAEDSNFDWNRWSSYYSNPVTGHIIEATHFSILKEPALTTLEPIINEAVLDGALKLES